VSKITDVTPIIIPSEVRAVRPLFFKIERNEDLIKSSKDGFNTENF